MGICYRVLLFDEFDWDYAGFNRGKVVEQVKEIVPHAVLEADICHMMIFDLDKSAPANLVGKNEGRGVMRQGEKKDGFYRVPLDFIVKHFYLLRRYLCRYL